MNDTSLLKNLSGLRIFSDLFTSENLAKGVDIMKRPAAIAIAASLGIHGVLGISFPLLSGSSPKERQTPVKLVDLTPDEQSKLPPQSPTSGIVLPPLNGPALPSTTNPAAGSFFKLQPNTPQTPFFNTSPASGTSSATQSNNSLFSSSVTPSIISPDYFLNSFAPSNAAGNTPLPPGPSSSPTSSPSPSPTGSPSPSPTASPTASPSPGVVPTPNPTATPGQSPVDPVRAAEDQKSRMLTGLKLNRQLQAKGGTSTSLEDQTTRLFLWQNSIVQTGKVTQQELEQNVMSLPISLACPAGDCSDYLVSFTVVVDRDGRLVGDPGLIRKTGDANLDKAAEQEFNKVLPELQKPPAKNRVTVYLIQVDFLGRRVG